MKKEYEHLRLEDRQIIYTMYDKKKTTREIGAEIGRSASTISRELNRNQFNRAQRRQLSPLALASIAHQKALIRRSDSKRIKKTPLKLAASRQYIIECMKDRKYSPETVEIKIEQDIGFKLSGKTIRRWICDEATELKPHLVQKGKKRRKRVTFKKRRFSNGMPKPSIHERELEANERSRIGDYEADLIVCNQSKVCILSVRERRTRKCWLRLLPNRLSETVRAGLVEVFANIPSILRKTCTFDNGSEFEKVYEVERLLGIKSYWCDAYCSWQKGSVEEQNKEVRVYIPKKTDLSTITTARLHQIEFYLNDKPRICLKKHSAEEFWQHAIVAARRSMN